MRASMRADLPAHRGHTGQLLPRHHCELVLVRTTSIDVDSRPRGELLASRKQRGNEDGPGKVEPLQDRKCQLAYRAICVVERHHQGLACRGHGHRLVKAHPTVPLPDEGGELSLKVGGRDRKNRLPALADGMVAENQYVRHGTSGWIGCGLLSPRVSTVGARGPTGRDHAPCGVLIARFVPESSTGRCAWRATTGRLRHARLLEERVFECCVGAGGGVEVHVHAGGGLDRVVLDDEALARVAADV